MVRVGRLELPASCSQSKRATNCATPGYEIFQLWSNMGSTPVFDQFPARGKSPSALASQNFPGFWGSAAQTPASRSQSRRATNCATPRYEIVELPGRFLPKNQRLFSQTRATQVSIPERRSENNPSRNFFASNEFADVIIQRRDLPAAIHIIILHIGYPSPQDHRHSLRHGPPLKLPSPWPWPPKLPQHSHLREHLPQTGHKCCPHRPLYAPDG